MTKSSRRQESFHVDGNDTTGEATTLAKLPTLVVDCRRLSQIAIVTAGQDARVVHQRVGHVGKRCPAPRRVFWGRHLVSRRQESLNQTGLHLRSDRHCFPRDFDEQCSHSRGGRLAFPAHSFEAVVTAHRDEGALLIIFCPDIRYLRTSQWLLEHGNSHWE